MALSERTCRLSGHAPLIDGPADTDKKRIWWRRTYRDAIAINAMLRRDRQVVSSGRDTRTTITWRLY
jgi:hypothetical protein